VVLTSYVRQMSTEMYSRSFKKIQNQNGSKEGREGREGHTNGISGLEVLGSGFMELNKS